MYGQDVPAETEDASATYGDNTSAPEDDQPAPARAGWTKSDRATLRSGKRESRRYFELGLLGLNLNFVGLSIENVLKGSFFDLNGFDPAKMDGFSADIGFFTNPVYLKISVRSVFDLDFFTRADANVNFDLPQKTLTSLTGIMDMANTTPPGFDSSTSPTPENLREYKGMLEEYMNGLQSIDAGMSASASMFMEMGMGISKTMLNDRLYVRAAPSLFFTLLYMKQNAVSLKSYSAENEYGLAGEGIMKLYSAWDLDRDINPFASPGLDLTLEACYALLPFLDTGLSVSHIPVMPSTLNHGKSIDASSITMTVKTPGTEDELLEVIRNPDSAVNINIPDTEDLLKDSDDENKKVTRPTRFDFFALLKPFKSPLLVVRPNVGFTMNSVIAPMLFNWGVDLQFNAPLIFSVFAGTGLTENIWAQRAGIMLDFRAFEVDIGAALTGKTFMDCFSAQKGLSLGIGLKLGF
jgi:hypothetical protein